MSGNPTAMSNNILVNCQSVDYSNDYVYVTTKGIPAYATGPFPDGNPSQAQNQNAILNSLEIQKPIQAIYLLLLLVILECLLMG